MRLSEAKIAAADVWGELETRADGESGVTSQFGSFRASFGYCATHSRFEAHLFHGGADDSSVVGLVTVTGLDDVHAVLVSLMVLQDATDGLSQLLTEEVIGKLVAHN